MTTKGAAMPASPVARATPYRWISAEDIVRHALAAYYAACRNYDRWAAEADPLDDEPDGCTDFAENVGELFTFRLHDQGYRAGVPGFQSACSDHMQAHPEYWGLEREYVDNSPANPASNSRVQDIHWRCTARPHGVVAKFESRVSAKFKRRTVGAPGIWERGHGGFDGFAGGDHHEHARG
ncbi:MAG: hypothetical protein MZW92_30325 [Comamonadaceae bacterium]|nr:hypothetical protein [Comamonadaceae bacterium]